MRQMTGVALATLLVTPAWAQGTQPRVGRTATGKILQPAEVSATHTAGASAPRGRTIRPRGGVEERGVWVTGEGVEFLDEGGKAVSLLNVHEGNRRFMVVDKARKHVLVVEGGRREDRPWFLRYLDDRGRELWTADLCQGDRSGFLQNSFAIAEDGSLVAVLDVGEGDTIEDEDGFTPAPRGCLGLRVFTAGGRLALNSLRGTDPRLSPRGQYLTFHDGANYCLLSLASGKRIPLPLAEGRYGPVAVEDTGESRYFHGGGWDPPGTPRYRHVPGKGLERLPDQVAGPAPASTTESKGGK